MIIKYNTATLTDGSECHFAHVHRQRVYRLLFTAMHGEFYGSSKGKVRTVLINECLTVSLKILYKAMHESLKLGLSSIYIQDDCHMFYHNVKTIRWGY